VIGMSHDRMEGDRTMASAATGWSRGLIIPSVLAITMLASCGSGTRGLVGPTWQWTHATEFAPFAHTDVADPSLYTLSFQHDGTVHVKAGCNSVSGTYVASGQDITLSLGPSTLVACPDGSLGDRFVDLLHTASVFRVETNGLTFRLDNEGGRMTFSREG
jgi:heat shock protein HslJ